MVENSRINDVIIKASAYATDPSKVCSLSFFCSFSSFFNILQMSLTSVCLIFFPPHQHTHTHTHTHTPPSLPPSLSFR